jgi:hypothetical protein
VKVFATLMVDKRIAEKLKSNPDHVELITREAETSMNVTALERRQVIAERPKLVQITESAIAKDQLELRFEAHTRSI